MESVFISGTTKGFGEGYPNWRLRIKEILQKQDMIAIEQSLLEPESAVVKREIEEKISSADGVICLVGPYYGTRLEKPPAAGGAAYSYTQYEWGLTRRFNKPSRVYLAEDQFFGDEAIASEVSERDPYSVHFREWQNEFCAALRRRKEEHHQLRVSTPLELALALARINWRKWPRE